MKFDNSKLHSTHAALIEKEEPAGLSTASMAKLARNKNVNTDILIGVCEALNCELSDIAEMVNDNNNKKGCE